MRVYRFLLLPIFSLTVSATFAADAPQGFDHFFANKAMESKFMAFQNQRDLLVQKNPKLKIITLAKAKERKSTYLAICKNNPLIQGNRKAKCEEIFEAFCKLPYSFAMSMAASMIMDEIYTSVNFINAAVTSPKTKEAGSKLIAELAQVRTELQDHTMALGNISDAEHMR